MKEYIVDCGLIVIVYEARMEWICEWFFWCVWRAEWECNV